ncbi:MAG: DNA translocase FtsK [Acholeplasmatales bacterium]|nr:DNA translocase FtsK [Acholeplasmatales bacterium]
MKRKKIVFEDDQKFSIPQVYRPREHMKDDKTYRPSSVASPFHGSNVVDKQTYLDNSGTVNIDEPLDYARKDEDKHLSKEDLVKKYGTEFYEFDILNNEKIAQAQIFDDKKIDKKHELGTAKEITYSSAAERKKAEGDFRFNSFITSLDDLDKDLEEPVVEEPTIAPEEEEFKINVETNEEEMRYNDEAFNLPKVEPNPIPNYVSEEEKEEFNPEELKFDELPDLSVDMRDLDSDNEDLKEEPVTSFNDEFNEPTQTYQEPVRPASPAEPTHVEEDKPAEENKKVDYSNYYVPYDRFFSKRTKDVDEHPQWLEEKKEIINRTLKSFDVDGEVINYVKGPSFTLYEIMLAEGVKVNKINSIQVNLLKDLQTKSIRILAPIPGKNTVGIEAPNDETDIVMFGDCINEQFINDGKPLNVVLGKDIYGNAIYQNIPDMPHALIAGATQSGKSVSISTIILSLIVKNSPDVLKLILIDPKKVEFSFYAGLPHLVTPVITEPIYAVEALKWACKEMDRRYDVFAINRCRKLSDYNAKRKENPSLDPMPFIVIIVDEFNDLAMQCGQELNDCIVRLAQKARACGIHIILATQRPTVNVINGTIKANIPCRIAFRVTSAVDSNTILDEAGAENLLGWGDMLIKNNGDPIRAQGAYVPDSEIEKVCDYLAEKYDPSYIFTDEDLKNIVISNNQKATGGGDGGDEDDELLYAVAEFCLEQQNCSINAIQTRFSLGFRRASSIVNKLESLKIVSGRQGTKPRDILVDMLELRKIFGIDE